MESLDEWGLGGRQFGTWVTWFLLGGDLYTAYTFVAVPAAMFAAGAVAGFFAVPYTIVLYPIIFIFMAPAVVGQPPARLRHPGRLRPRAGTARAGSPSPSRSPASSRRCRTSRSSSSASRRCSRSSGLGGGDSLLAKDLPLFIAFALLAAYTYSSGLRAPAVIAFVKDTLIYLVIIVAIIYLPAQGRRLGHDLRRRRGEDGGRQPRRPASRPASFIPGAGAVLGLRHPRPRLRARAVHVPALDHREPVGRDAEHDPAQRGDPAGLLLRARPAGPARLGRDRGRHQADRRSTASPTRSWSSRSCSRTPSRRWFAGVAFAAIAIGALVPAAIMSIAAANTFTRNIYKEWLRPDATPAQEAKVSKLASLVVKAFALVFVLTARQAERDQLPAARRHLDPPDLPGDRPRSLHPVVPPLGAARRLGRRHGLRDLAGVERREPARRRRPLRWLARADPGHRRAGLHRPHRLRHQPPRRGRPHRGAPTGQGPGRRRRDDPWGLLRGRR